MKGTATGTERGIEIETATAIATTDIGTTGGETTIDEMDDALVRETVTAVTATATAIVHTIGMNLTGIASRLVKGLIRAIGNATMIALAAQLLQPDLPLHPLHLFLQLQLVGHRQHLCPPSHLRLRSPR